MSVRYPRRPVGAGRSALRAYRHLPLTARLHATIRWWSAPFSVLEAQVPDSGRILEIGCGHGLFCTYLALAEPSRTVVGVDIDADKIAQAQQVARDLGRQNLRFEVATSGTVAAGPWDAIAIVDMLYLLPEPAQHDLLIAAAAELAPGGVLLVKEMSTTPRWKARWNTVQETVSVSVLGITDRNDESTPAAGVGGKSPRFVFVDPVHMAEWFSELHLHIRMMRLDRHRLHPHHLLAGRRENTADPAT